MDKSDGKLPMDGILVQSVKVPDPNGVKKVRFQGDADPQVGSVFGSGQASGFSVYSRAAVGVPFSTKPDPMPPSRIVRLVIRDSSTKEDLERPGELCWICGMNFLSVTTLYNHQLQCPPPEKVKEEVGSGSGSGIGGSEPEPAQDLIAALPGNWSVKAKRGTGEIFVSVREQQEMELAASALLEMYYLELEKIEARKYQDKNIHLLPMGSSWTYMGFKDFFGKWPKIGGLGAGAGASQTFKGKEEPTSYFLEQDSPPRKKIKQQWKYDSPSPPPSSPEALFKCPVCHKGFTSYQAMGGHRSSHNKPKNA